jgi:hypothetical protein
MSLFRFVLYLVLLEAVSLFVVACGTVTPEPDVQASPLSTSTLMPMNSPGPTPSLTTTPTVEPTLMQLLVLHTNDNWGETEPCG